MLEYPLQISDPVHALCLSMGVAALPRIMFAAWAKAPRAWVVTGAIKSTASGVQNPAGFCASVARNKADRQGGRVRRGSEPNVLLRMEPPVEPGFPDPRAICGLLSVFLLIARSLAGASSPQLR